MIKRLLLLLFLGAALFAPQVFAACSTTYQGKVVINEYNYTNNYIELKVLDPAVLAATGNLNNWSLTLKINSGGGRTTTQNVGSVVGNPAQNTCGATTATYIRIPFASNEMENDAVALLKDEAGNEVDLLKMKQDSHSYPALTPTCTSWAYDTVLNPDMDSSGPKDIARYPDGTGNWTVSPGTGAGSFETPCTTNNDVAKLTKTVNVTSAAPGASLAYTLTLTNDTGEDAFRIPFFQSPITVTDVLPAGLSYSGATLTPPSGDWACWLVNLLSSYDSTTGAWRTYCLPDGGTQTLVINATVLSSACPATSITNTAQLSSGLAIPGGATLPPVSASFNLSCMIAAQGFNAVETGALTPDASVASGRLFTKLAGTAFVFDVVALNVGNSRETGFGTKSVAVELVDASSGTCTSYASLAPAQTQTLNFLDADQGRKTVAPFTVGRAYRRLAVRMTGDGITRCSSDLFAVRPPSFVVSSSDANADATGVSTTATPRIAAGASFSLQAVATAGYDGTPTLSGTAGRWQAHGASAVHVTPSGSFAAADAASGTASGNAFVYNDVGYFRLAETGAVEDTSFTAVDQSADCTDDFSNTLVNGKYGCKIGNAAPSDYFGRFVPHHFAVVPAATVTHRADIGACAASTFTYLGEPLKLSFVLQAQHAGNGVTKKYEGSFGKLALAYAATAPASLAFKAAAGTTSLTGELDFACPGCGSTGAWAEGAASVVATLAVKRPSALPLPHYAAASAVAFGIRPDDGDIDHALAVYDADMDAALPLNDHLLLKKSATDALTADYLFGRMRLTTIYGSDRQQLNVPVEMQVWNGIAFVTASADSCTPLVAGNVALSPGGISSVSSIKALAAGRGGIVLAAPAAAQRSTVRVCADLGAAAHVGLADDAGCAAASPASLRYLTGPWDGTNGFYGNDPSARAHFGLYGAPYIYYRER
ncbi:DUF11 domain-containing protein [Azospira restricta]|uniref:DUF11 domain-containing protein n=1 Tax=Azospira restricta TaxID=404405 RepID=A0A974SRG5_9RHOO|nr:DUF11 domain-containing protein [Azospira restricta]QRJ65092.1 DUF11 domain-containing protein [Azospira restricta]